MAEIKYEIKDSVGVLSENNKGWSKEVNIVSWNERKPKIDIREWDETHEKMGKGITLSKEEAEKLKEFLNQYDFNSLED